MTDEQLYKIADLMLEQFKTGFSRTYLYCIAREGAKGLTEAGLNGDASRDQVYSASKKSISRYFTAWSDDLNKELAESFTNAYFNG